MRSLPSSNDLIISLQKGGPDALQSLLKQFYSPLCLFAERLLKDKAASEDIVGESFIKLWNKRADFESLQNIKAFMYITVRNACLNYIKRVQRDSVMKSGFSNYLSTEHEEFALNEMIRAEVLQEIYVAIEALPSRCKKVFKLCYVEGLSNSDVAERFSISVNTVKNHKVKALGLLRLKFLNTPSMM